MARARNWPTPLVDSSSRGASSLVPGGRLGGAESVGPSGRVAGSFGRFFARATLVALVRWRLFAVRRLFAGPGPFSTSRAALVTIFGSAGLSCSTDEPPAQ